MAKTLGELPVGTLVKDITSTYYGQPIVWKIADQNHEGYPANSTTLIADKIIKITCFDSTENDSSDSDHNKGNNNYMTSNIRQWLNSEGAAGSWWSAQDTYDAPPTYEYYEEAGFMTNLSAKFKAVLLITTLNSIRHYKRSGKYYDTLLTVQDRIFLASSREVLGCSEGGSGWEGSRLAFFSAGNTLLCYPTAEAIAHSTWKSESLAVSKPWNWWLRTSDTSCTYKARCITSEGRMPTSNDTINNANSILVGVRPLCNLLSSTVVSDEPGSDGIYRIAYSLPTISDTDSDLGLKTASFAQNYTVTAEAGLVITAIEKLDGMQIRSYTAQSGDLQTFNVAPKDDFIKLKNGNHTLTIIAQTQYEGISTRTYTFRKNETKIEILRSTPMSADAMPERVSATVFRIIPQGAIFKIYVCNNGADDSPTWEDATNELAAGMIYSFTNKTKTAENWGVNIKVCVDRNGATGECAIQGIEGRFD